MSRRKDIEFFIEHGWVALPGAFTAKQAEPYARRALQRLPLISDPPLFDGEGRPIGVTLPYENNFPLASFSPSAWKLILDLVGGEESMEKGAEFSLSDGFVVTLPNAPQWRPPASTGFRWHIDRDDQDLFLKISAMRIGLVVYGLWSDVGPRGGGTFMAPGALPALARWMNQDPAGGDLANIPMKRLLDGCDPEYFEMTGAAGTIVLAHPLLIHAPSLNVTDRPRLLSVKKVILSRPRRAPSRAASQTPFERATQRALAHSK
jgi:hypothetical protein